jgi:hypothetical protein
MARRRNQTDVTPRASLHPLSEHKLSSVRQRQVQEEAEAFRYTIRKRDCVTVSLVKLCLSEIQRF